MAKATFRRLVKSDPGVFILSMNFVLAGIFFVIGSILFWPGLVPEAAEECETAGALLFLVGSAMYSGGAGLDYVRMGQELLFEEPEITDTSAMPDTPGSGSGSQRSSLGAAEVEMADFNSDPTADSPRSPRRPHATRLVLDQHTEMVLEYSSDNLDAPPEIEVRERGEGSVVTMTHHAASNEELSQMSPGERYTILYKRFIIKSQRLNALIYACAAFIFVVGSCFFLPQASLVVENKNIHGCWLFIAGSALSMCGAFLGAKTAEELAITSQPRQFVFSPHDKRCRHMWSHSDEQITIKSCTSYMYGCMLFIVGTAFFYPSLNETCWKIGTVLFVIGSVCFLIGACMDYCLLERTYFEGSMSHIFEHDQLQAAGDPGVESNLYDLNMSRLPIAQLSSS